MKNRKISLKRCVFHYTVPPGGDAGVWIKRTLNCTGRYEITSFGVDYIYEGKNYTTDLDFDPWIVDIVIKK